MPKIIDHDARRRELVEASWNVIAKEGLEGLTMRKIAAAANCTTGRITHYFANREALVLASLQSAYDASAVRLNEIIAADLEPLEKLRRAVEETLPLDQQRLNEWRVWIAYWGAATTDPELAQQNDTNHERWLEAMIPLVHNVAPASDARHETYFLLGLIDGLGLRAAVNPTKENANAARAALSDYLNQLADQSQQKGAALSAAPKRERSV